jgi:hypothetical protein
MPDKNTVKFECHHCSQSIEAPMEMLGVETQCPTCGKVVTVLTAKRKGRVWKYLLIFGCFCAALVLLAAAFIGYILWRHPFEQVMATPRKANVPITGAFGFALGETLPAEYVLKDGFAYVENYTDAPPFNSVQLACLPDRTIYTIVGYGYSNSDQVVQALELKYGPGSLAFTKNGETHVWTNGDGKLAVDVFGDSEKAVHVTYTSVTLQQRSFDEDEKAVHDGAKALTPKL